MELPAANLTTTGMEIVLNNEFILLECKEVEVLLNKCYIYKLSI
jgi:hypothetical protein